MCVCVCVYKYNIVFMLPEDTYMCTLDAVGCLDNAVETCVDNGHDVAFYLCALYQGVLYVVYSLLLHVL